MRIHPLFLLLSGLVPASAGVVVDLSGEALPNVAVTQGAYQGVTTRGGTWSLLPTQVVRSVEASASSRPGLRIDGSRLRIEYRNRDLAGRVFDPQASHLASRSSARQASLTSTDSATFSWKGAVLARYSASEFAALDTVRLDTAWSDDHGFPWNTKVRYGSLTDSRDGKTYRTVRIGGLVWMAENLDFEAPLSTPGHAGFGRFYDWATSLGMDTSLNRATPESVKPITTLRGICPEGWLLPDTSTWTKLQVELDRSRSGTAPNVALQSLTGWPEILYMSATNSILPTPSDVYGFRALPIGVLDTNGRNVGTGKAAGWWTYREPEIVITMMGAQGIAAMGYAVDSTGNSPKLSSYRKSMGLSVRCFQAP